MCVDVMSGVVACGDVAWRVTTAVGRGASRRILACL